MSQETNFRDNEKKIYQLLYKNPICEYINSKSNELNVLIVGKDINFEAFKAILWCGQYPDTTLNITVCCDDTSKYKADMEMQMPALKEFVSFNGSIIYENPLANIFLITERDSKIKQKYDYVLILDNKSFWEQKINKYECNKIINLEEKKETEKKETEKKETEKEDELKRLAENINFAYALKENERAHFEGFDEKDEKKRYKQKSSYASAVHISSKLKYCEQFVDKNIAENHKQEKALEVLIKAINAAKSEPNKTNEEFLKIYNHLVVLEHHRWMAYTISEGWEKPSKKILCDYFKHTNDHKHKTENKKYHACLYDCTIDDLQLSINEYKDVCNNPEKYLSDEINNLKDISLFCYAVLCEQTKNINELILCDVYTLSQHGYKAEMSKYIHAINQLIEDVDDSAALYKTALNELKNIYSYEKIQKNVERIDQNLNLVKERNKKTNFFSIDSQLIDLIPFCLWYRKKYKTVITISGGKIFDDIKVPLLLNSQNNIFITNEVGYEERVKRFFRNYGNNAEIKVLQLKEDAVLMNNYEQVIDEAIIDDDVVISIGEGADFAAVIAVGKKSENYTVVTYRYPDMIFYDKNIPESYCIDNKNLTIYEYMKLCQWNVRTQGEEVIEYNVCKDLSELFWELSERKFYKTELNKNVYYTIWEKLHEQYKIDEKDSVKIYEEKEIKWEEKYKNGDLQTTVTQKMLDFLKKLRDNKIIDFKDSLAFNNKVKITVENDKIYNILSQKSGTLFENIVYYNCKYSGVFNDVKTGVKIKRNNTDNEIDIIATKGLCAIFISCKTNALLDKTFIYEIHSEAKLFGGIPVIAVSQTLAEKDQEGKIKHKHEFFTDRAKDWGVSLLDANIIKDDEKFNRAMRRILAGEIVSPLDAEFHTQQEDKK